MSPTLSGALLVIISAVGFACMPIFASFAYVYEVNVLTLLFLRFSLAALLLFAILICRRNQVWPNLSQLGRLGLLGAVLYALQSTCYFLAAKYTSPGLTSLILYTYPVLVAAYGILRGYERLTLRTIAALAASSLGITLIIGTIGTTINSLGVALAFAAAVVYTCYIVISKELTKELPALVMSAFVTLFAAASFFLLGMFTGELQPHAPGAAWLPIGGLVLIATVMAIITFFAGLERVGPTRASILSTTEPFVTVVLAAVCLKQSLSLTQLCGGLAILSGTFLVIMPQAKPVVGTDPLKPHP
ncbi:MAG TPA: EamA family transporter [Firmicutes bacterium]|jgi:drug/metabolite transporter (DMT)-like permease|nr:EamA family transporter [Bacillota bacterium]